MGNNAGGVLGGISTGQDVVVSIALKPTSSIRVPRRSIDKQGEAVMMQTTGRHDPCVGIRATPIAEAMLALVLIDHALRHRAQNADVAVDQPGPALRRVFLIGDVAEEFARDGVDGIERGIGEDGFRFLPRRFRLLAV